MNTHGNSFGNEEGEQRGLQSGGYGGPLGDTAGFQKAGQLPQGGPGFLGQRETDQRFHRQYPSGGRSLDDPSGLHETAGPSVETGRGPHYGKGPKDFVFTDEEIKREISVLLYRAGNIDASEVEVDVAEGEVSLRGHVESRLVKRRIEDLIAAEVTGVWDIHNALRIRRGEKGTSS